ncbi:MAG: hypothetical protein SGCHY_003452, partial [Lobulomycetales sp.]
MGKVLVQDNRQKKISGISFGVFSDQQLKQLSVLELHERNIYDISGPQRVPAKFGVLDNRLGPTGKGSLCGTCGEPHQKCVGHFGVVRLTLPVFHVGFFKLMITVLQNICKTCSRVLLEETACRAFLARIRNPNIDDVQRKEILRSLNAACKK